PGVPKRVGQRLLHDPERGEVDPGRQIDRIALDAEVDGEPGVADLLEQLLDPGEPRLWRELGPVLGAAQHAEQAAHLRERLPAGLLDGLERLALALLLGREQPPDA